MTEQTLLTPEQIAEIEETRSVVEALPEGLVIVPSVKFDFQGFYAIGRSVLGMTHHQAFVWTEGQYHEFVDYIADLKPRDVVIVGTELEAVNGEDSIPAADQGS